MAKSFDYAAYPYWRSEDQDATAPVHHPVVVVGGGMVGLAFAVDMALKGNSVVVLDDNNQVSVGSRSICVAKRTLEIFDRLGIGDRCVEKGITWNVGKVLRGDTLLYEFNLLPEEGHKRPAFINLQQYYVETYLVDRFNEIGVGELRWFNTVTGIEQHDDHITLCIDTPDGPYSLTCDWLIAADGVKSTVRAALDLPFVGETFHDHFLITDVVMQSDFPVERRFWFDPSFHGGGSALLHKQPDDVWRIDLQLGPEADRDEEMKEENILPRLYAMLGDDAEFTIDWGSLYTFQCRRLEKFRHDRILFVGDSAHTVSPFGARGGNGGIQDIDNLGWKLAAVLAGEAGEGLLDSYDAERIPAADENILNSTRATDFMAPKNTTMALFREAVLDLAEQHPFARAFVNSGRLSVPYQNPDSPLSSPDTTIDGGVEPGRSCLGAPVAKDGETGWLLDHLGGAFCLLRFGDTLPGVDLPQICIGHDLDDPENFVAHRYAGAPGVTYLIRPDQHVAARWIDPDPAEITTAHQHALGNV